jgi:hypothetical protein
MSCSILRAFGPGHRRRLRNRVTSGASQRIAFSGVLGHPGKSIALLKRNDRNAVMTSACMTGICAFCVGDGFLRLDDSGAMRERASRSTRDAFGSCREVEMPWASSSEGPDVPPMTGHCVQRQGGVVSICHELRGLRAVCIGELHALAPTSSWARREADIVSGARCERSLLRKYRAPSQL